jgi:hypothetical protein
MVRTGEKSKIFEAMQHAKKFLVPHSDTQSVAIQHAAGILAFSPGSDVERYKVSSAVPQSSPRVYDIYLPSDSTHQRSISIGNVFIRPLAATF